MDRSAYLRLVRGETRGPIPTLGRVGLSVAAAAYRPLVQARNLAYDLRWKTAHRAEVPVVSVGNLTLGGTGKTPAVEYICRWYRERGLRVAILSRGYGATEGLNDEGRVLDQNLPDVPHLQSPDRVGLARIAVEELEAEILVLDDGFQHRRLARDLDIVLIDALQPFGLDRLFPRGLLREPIAGLRRAGVVLLSRADLVEEPRRREIRRRVERVVPGVPWIESRQAPRDLLDASGQSSPLEGLRDRAAVAFCGLGNPDGFRRTLENLGVTLLDFRSFPDHHDYPRSDVFDLIRWAQSSGAGLVLTTQKDSVKLPLDSLGPVPLRALRIGLEPLEGREHLDRALAGAVDRRGRG